MELYLANKLTERAMFEYVQLARYISAPIALRYGTSGPITLHPFRKDEMSLSSHQVIGQPLENLKNALYLYKKRSKLS